MKKLKGIFTFVIAGIIGMSMTSCNSSGGSNSENKSTSTMESSSTPETNTKANDKTGDTQKKVKIGILQPKDHDALALSCDGFKAALKDGGYIEGENLDIDFQNAQGDQANLKTMSQRFVKNNVDLILAIATQAAQSVAAETENIPILVTAVTDLEDAKLVKSNEKPETNVTGTSDMNPIKEQIDLLKKLVPDAKTVGILYTSSEDNSILQANIAKEAITNIGLNFEERTVTSPNDVQQAVQSLAGKVEVMYIPTDNTMASSMPIVSEIANKNKIPTICGEANMVMSGGLATLGIDYYKLGYQTGEMAIKVLKGESIPADMPVETQKDMEYTINKSIAEQLGITIPEDLEQYMK